MDYFSRQFSRPSVKTSGVSRLNFDYGRHFLNFDTYATNLLPGHKWKEMRNLINKNDQDNMTAQNF